MKLIYSAEGKGDLIVEAAKDIKVPRQIGGGGDIILTGKDYEGELEATHEWVMPATTDLDVVPAGRKDKPILIKKGDTVRSTMIDMVAAWMEGEIVRLENMSVSAERIIPENLTELGVVLLETSLAAKHLSAWLHRSVRVLQASRTPLNSADQ